jgi:hypothetical protein
MTTEQHRRGFVDYWPPADIIAAMASASWAGSGRTAGQLLVLRRPRVPLVWQRERMGMDGGDGDGDRRRRLRHQYQALALLAAD